MAWSVYSPEDFPKWDRENGHWVDYKQALQVQVVFKAGQWKKLEEFYRHVRFESWVDASGDGRETVVTSKDVALRLAGDFRLLGIVAADLDKITDAEREALEKQSRERNLEFRQRFVNRFEEQFRTKMQGGPGRWVPNDYELECYKLLGLRPPDVVQKNHEAPAAPVIIEQKVDPEYLAQLVAAEVAKVTAPAPAKR